MEADALATTPARAHEGTEMTGWLIEHYSGYCVRDRH